VPRVDGLHPLPLNPAEQVTLPHNLQHVLVIHMTVFVPQSMGNPAVAVAGKLKADSLNPVS